MSRKINVLKLTAGSDIAEPAEIEDELEVYQKFVNGCIECVRFNERLVMVVNDEGLLRELPENIIGTILYWSITGQPVTPICGNFSRRGSGERRVLQHTTGCGLFSS